MRKRIFPIFLVFAAAAFIFASCSSGNENRIPDNTTHNTDGTVSITDGNTATTVVNTTDGSASTDVSTQIQLPSGEIDESNTIVQTAEALIGIEFTENGSTPTEGFDNSGFIYYVLRENGFINCPRLGRDQAEMGTNVGYSELKSGDLAFFCNNDSKKADFGGIYIGEGKMIYCPMPGQTVKETDITTEFWQKSFVNGVRLS